MPAPTLPDRLWANDYRPTVLGTLVQAYRIIATDLTRGQRQAHFARQMQAFPDRLLNDIGLERAHIDRQSLKVR